MFKFYTNKYRNLPFFVTLNFYYNYDAREIKREINESKRTPSSLTIDETIIDKTTGGHTKLEYIYELDKSAKTYLFYIIRPYIISILAMIAFLNLQYDFFTVLKINKPITFITFILSSFILLSILYAMIHILMIVYFKKKPNIFLISNFNLIQYLGYLSMILLFVAFYIIFDVRTAYIYTCLITLGTFSFFSYAFYIYCLLPLKMVINKELKFYRNTNDKKIILVELKD